MVGDQGAVGITGCLDQLLLEDDLVGSCNHGAGGNHRIDRLTG